MNRPIPAPLTSSTVLSVDEDPRNGAAWRGSCIETRNMLEAAARIAELEAEARASLILSCRFSKLEVDD